MLKWLHLSVKCLPVCLFYFLLHFGKLIKKTSFSPKGARKKIAFLAEALTPRPPPLAFSGHFMRVYASCFFTCINIKYMYMFLKQERPKVDDYERKKNFGQKGKILAERMQVCFYVLPEGIQA